MYRGVVLAGGKGTRLRPYTIAIPKPLMPIGDMPILEIIIRQLAAQGFGRVTLAVNHQADILRAYFETGHKWSIDVDYSLETAALSTMGPLKLIDDLPENFLVMNGDILTDLDYAKLLGNHVESGNRFTIAVSERLQRIDYGVIVAGDDQKVTGFEEKPTIPYLVSMGVYCLNRSVLDLIPNGEPFGFDQLVLRMLAEHDPISVHRHSGYWLDIGRPDDYQRAVDEWPTFSSTLEI